MENFNHRKDFHIIYQVKNSMNLRVPGLFKRHVKGINMKQQLRRVLCSKVAVSQCTVLYAGFANFYISFYIKRCKLYSFFFLVQFGVVQNFCILYSTLGC